MLELSQGNIREDLGNFFSIKCWEPCIHPDVVYMVRAGRDLMGECNRYVHLISPYIFLTPGSVYLVLSWDIRIIQTQQLSMSLGRHYS